ncbi:MULTISPECIES: hypothetical protein [Ralstonia]|jgi:hypothetical protein|uniref:hypothetical protein n=1 Tax=Ralstonia TaxID=48736 RepID=UPI0018EB2432|nr:MULTISPECIES: hypothetical protein [unclassified Ralstonia]
METMKKLLLALFLVLSFSAKACHPPFMNIDVTFEPNATRPDAAGMAKLEQWRVDTRRAFPAGFQVFMTLWENDSMGSSEDVARARAAFVTKFLITTNVNSSDIYPPEIRPIGIGSGRFKSEEAGINTMEIGINPRCPHVCCDPMLGGPSHTNF